MTESSLLQPANEQDVLTTLARLRESHGERIPDPIDVTVPTLVAAIAMENVTDPFIYDSLGYKRRTNAGSPVGQIAGAGLGEIVMTSDTGGRPARTLQVSRRGISFLAGYNNMREALVAERLRACGHQYTHQQVAISALRTLMSGESHSLDGLASSSNSGLKEVLPSDGTPNWDAISNALSGSRAFVGGAENDDAQARLRARAALEYMRYTALEAYLPHLGVPFIARWLKTTISQMVGR